MADPPRAVLSHFQATPLLEAREQGLTSAACSPDLGITSVTVDVTGPGVRFPNGDALSWAGFEEIAGSEPE